MTIFSGGSDWQEKLAKADTKEEVMVAIRGNRIKEEMRGPDRRKLREENMLPMKDKKS